MTLTSLANRVKQGLLDAVPVDPLRIERMVAAARQQLDDAMTTEVSDETRFDCAYNAIRMIADVALLRLGYRTLASKGGHHRTAIECLEHTLAVDAASLRTLDALRRQSNGSNYDGDGVTGKALTECIEQARAMMARFEVASK